MNFMKKATLGLGLILGLTACGDQEAKTTSEEASSAASDVQQSEAVSSTDAITLNVFAAASMTETMEQVKEKYKAIAPNVEIVLTLDSSGTLKQQIESGADCDLFISAGQKQMNALDKDSDKNEKGLDFVDTATRIDLLENKVVLAVQKGNPKNISSFEQLGTDAVERIALGNADVPVGQYSEELLKNMNLWDALNEQQKITFGANVKEVTTQVSEGAVDCGIIYSTDAYSAGLEAVAQADASMLKTPVIYPAAVMKNSKHAEEAKALLDYLHGEEAMAIFQSVGFSPAPAK